MRSQSLKEIILITYVGCGYIGEKHVEKQSCLIYKF